MTALGHRPSPPRGPCPGFEEACTLSAWREPVSPEAQAHVDRCPRCQAAVAHAQTIAAVATELAGEPPRHLRQGLAVDVLAATTRRQPDPARSPRAWIGAAAGLAAAGLAAVTWWRGQGPGEDTVPDFATVDLELLEDLDLAENLDLLEILDALEEMDDA